MFIYIIHCATEPSLSIGGQGKVISLTFTDCISRLIYGRIDPDVIEVVCIGMPDDQIHIVEPACIRKVKNDFWFKITFPLLTGEGNRFFKDVRIQGAGNE